MCPVFEDGLVDALDPMQMGALVSRDTREQNVVVATLDHVDRVDLDVAQVLYRGPRRLGPAAERHGRVEPLRVQPDTLRLSLAEQLGFAGNPGHAYSGMLSQLGAPRPRRRSWGARRARTREAARRRWRTSPRE